MEGNTDDQLLKRPKNVAADFDAEELERLFKLKEALDLFLTSKQSNLDVYKKTGVEINNLWEFGKSCRTDEKFGELIGCPRASRKNNLELDTESIPSFSTKEMEAEHNPIVSRPFQKVQLDMIKLDLPVLSHKIERDHIIESETIDRVWLLVIVDISTRLVMGYHLCFKKEYSNEDVLLCIKNSIIPKEDYKFAETKLKRSTTAGFHSLKFPECKWAVWDEISIDTMKDNLADAVKDRLFNIMNCRVNAESGGIPQRRAIVERFFGVLEDYNYHRLFNSTWSEPNDLKWKRNITEEAIKYGFTEKELEELTELAIAEYNCTPHSSLNFLSPLEKLELQIKNGQPIRLLPEKKRNDFRFILKFNRKVLGSVKSGKRPYVRFENGFYRNETLAQNPRLIGQTLTLWVDPDDLRTIRAFQENGKDLGLLYVGGKWSERKDSLSERREESKDKHKKMLSFTEQDDPIKAFHDYLEKSEKNRKDQEQKSIIKRGE